MSAFSLSGSPAAQAATTTTWTHCANEGQTCSFSGSRQVRFGANTTYAVLTKTSSVVCSNAVFGDPLKYTAKSCDYSSTTDSGVTTPVVTPPVTVPTPVSTPTGSSPGPGVFVDADNGSDSGAGTFASPWKSLSKLAGAKVAAGAGVYLKCGSTWHESLDLGASQLQNGSIVAGYGPACAAGSNAVISGADDFTGGWAPVGGGIWKRKVPTTTPQITQLFIGSTPYRIAQWPKFGGIGHEYAIAGTNSPASNNVLMVGSADLAALAGKDLINATILVKVEPWIVESSTVGSYNASSGQIGLASATHYGMEAGDGYVLQGKRWMLDSDSAGEFFHDKANGDLYVYPKDAAAQAALNSGDVEGTVRSTAVQISNRSGLKIANIGAIRAATIGLTLSNTASAAVSSIDVSDNGTVGLRVIRNSGGTAIRSSTFNRNANMAIDASSVSGVTIATNSITNTGMSASPTTTDRAIWNGPSGITTQNVVQNSAYSGIGFSGTGGSQVTKNIIEDSCQRFSDGASIYTWNGGGATANQSSLVQGNLIVRGAGNTEGSVGGASDLCMGIYTDEGARSVVISGNTLMDVMIGIKVHNSSYVTVDSNRVWLAKRTALWLNMDHKDKDAAVGNVFSNNELNVAVAYTGTYPQIPQFSTDYKPIWFWHTLSGLGSITSGGNRYSGNQMLMLNGDSAAAATVRGPSGMVSYSTSEWRKLNPAEAAPQLASEFSTYTATYGPELVANGDFLKGWTDGWWAWFASASPKGSVSVAAATGCSSACAVMSASTISDVVATPTFAMPLGGLMRLKFNAAFQNNGALARPGPAAGTGLSSFANLSDTAGSTVNYEGFFTAKSALPNRVNFGAAPGTRVGIDSVSVKPITSYTLAKPHDWASYAYAPPTASRVIDCTALGWAAGCTGTDGDGVALSIPFTLAAGQAQLVLKRDPTWRVK